MKTIDRHKYDHIVLGGSIMAILNAIAAAQNGRKVALLEKSNVLGGAWQKYDLSGFGETELGPHVLRFHKETYEFIDRNFLEMKLVTPGPIWLLHKPIIGLDRFPFKYVWVRDLLILRDRISSKKHPKKTINKFDQINKLDKTDPIGFWEILTNVYKIILSSAYEKFRLKPHIMYMKGGTVEFINRLHRELMQLNVDVHFSTVANTMEISKQQISIKANNYTFDGDTLYMTTGVALANVEINGIKQTIKNQPLLYHQIFVLLDADELKFSYIEVIGHPHIKRVFDITEYTTNYEHLKQVGQRLITATFTDANQTGQQLYEELMNYLLKKKLVSLNQSFRYLDENIYQINSYASSEVEELISSDPRCRIVRATDLSYAIKLHVDTAGIHHENS